MCQLRSRPGLAGSLAIGHDRMVRTAARTTGAAVTATGPAATEVNRPGIAHVLAARDNGAASKLQRLRLNNLSYHGGVSGSGGDSDFAR